MKNVKAVLAQLHKELQRAEDIDIDARKILQDLHRDVERLEDVEDAKMGSLADRAKALESKFAANHPVLEQLARELADAIAKMGV